MGLCRIVLEGSLVALALWLLLRFVISRRFARWTAVALVPVCVAATLWARGRLDAPWAAGSVLIGLCAMGAEFTGLLPRSKNAVPGRGVDRLGGRSAR